MYEEYTPESIKESMKEGMEGVSVIEGSFTDQIFSAVADAVYGYMDGLEALEAAAFVDGESGEWIDMEAAKYGMERKPGTAASVTLTFSGEDGTAIPEGSTVEDEAGRAFATDAPCTIADGAADVLATATEPGEDGNVAAGRLIYLSDVPDGVTGVTNAQPAAGGTEEETDEALYERIYQFRSRPATSGNVAAYERWALECPGVGKVAVIPLENGPGSVGIVVATEENGAVGQDAVAKAQAYIDEQRPIGAAATVRSAIELPVNITAEVTLEGGTAEETAAELRDHMEANFRELTPGGAVIRRSAIGAWLMGIDGVQDYTVLEINAKSENLYVQPGYIPKAGEVTIHAD